MSVYTIYVDLFLDGVIHVINVINQQPSPEGVPFPLDLTVGFSSTEILGNALDPAFLDLYAETAKILRIFKS
jgi:hypothetical protein